MLISIPGHSNFGITVVEEDNKTIVIKKSYNKQDSLRLEKQAKKQQHFINTNVLTRFNSPTILFQGFIDDLFYFKMDYINNIDIIHYFEINGKDNLQQFVRLIISLIESFINQSQFLIIKKEIIIDKYNSIKQIIYKNNIAFDFKDIDIIIHETEELFLPVGNCHGDLTFSNILLGRNGMITLIDFLDSFIETPLCDMVKIRQDTQYRWSQLLYTKDYDILKVNIVFDYLDKLFNEEFLKYEFYRKYYKIFQIINLLRVLQYSKNEKIVNNLKEKIIVLTGK